MKPPRSTDPFAKCILCGTDFSERAMRAADAAAAFAVRLGEPLWLVHSVCEAFREQLPPGAFEALAPTVGARLRAEAARVRQCGAVVEEAFLPGVPDEGINEFARRVNARLIVFGYPALGVLSRWLTGSVSEIIAESSTVPTLLVHSPEPFAKWTRGEGPLRIFIATDFTATSEAALRWVSELLDMGPCEITLGCVDRPADEGAELATPGAAGLSGETPEASQTLRRELGKAAKVFLCVEPTIRIVPHAAPAERRLLELADEARADLLVTGTHQRHGIERLRYHSVSRAIIRHSPISVACVPLAIETAGAGRAASVLP